MSTTDAVNRLLAGHVGYLTSSQEEALQDLQARLEDAGLYKPVGKDDRPPSHDDTTLLRYLRARSWSPIQAHQMFAESVAWRAKYDVDNLYARSNAEEMQETRKLYPVWTGRRDKIGRPLNLWALRLFNDPQRLEQLGAVTPEKRYEQLIAVMEFRSKLVFNLCSALPSASYPTPISASSMIVDLEGVSISLIWKLRAHLQQASKLASANYPETLAAIFLVNAPSFFPAVWEWLKGWFDLATRDKIHILSKANEKEVLLEWIDKEDLMQDYGGQLVWSYDDSPALDAPAKELLSSTRGQVPLGPCIFEHGGVRSA